MTPYEKQTVGSIAAANAATLRIFESAGIDYCCGGKLSLGEACEKANVPLETVVNALEKLDRQPKEQQIRKWSQASLSELIEHIVGTHHAYVRNEIPRLEALLVKVNGRHGAFHPALPRIQELFGAAAQELQAHMLKEERMLFPYIVNMETAIREQLPEPTACFGSVEFPISRMIADHDDAGELFATIRALANDYTPPEGACQSFIGLYRGIEEFERDLHQHIHLENNILFPRAIEMERSLKETVNAAP